MQWVFLTGDWRNGASRQAIGAMDHSDIGLDQRDVSVLDQFNEMSLFWNSLTRRLYIGLD